MKINPLALESAYSATFEKATAKKSTSADLAKNAVVDTAESSVSRDSLADIKTASAAAAEKGTDPDRLRQLRDAVASGTYSVSESDIAGAILR